MIDLKSVEIELKQARTARIATESAVCDVEDLIWQIQHAKFARPSLAVVIGGELQLGA